MPVTRIDRYEIRGRIGGGGMGTVYLARDTNPKTDRLVALKLLKATLDAEDLRQRFTLEAQSLAELSHPNIVSIHDSGEFEGSPFIVMEYVRGETLSELIRRRSPLTLGVKLRLLTELCAGLSHAHSAGLIHRDIKPANLVMDMHGHLRILDFGIARASDPGQTRPYQPLTQLNTQIGTPGYMSPEQIEGAEIDARSDVFAVGTVAYELIAYREAFGGSNTRQIEHRVLNDTPVPLTELVPGLDADIVSLIDSALVKDVAGRCSDATTLWAGFQRISSRLGELQPMLRITPIPRGSGERKSKRRRNAEAAFARAQASADDGAPEYARRSAIEALAEQPDHEGARRLLERLGRFEDVRPWLRPIESDAGKPHSQADSPSVEPVPDPTVLRTPAPVRPSGATWGRYLPYAALAAAAIVVAAIALLVWPLLSNSRVEGPTGSPPPPPKVWRLSITRPEGGTVTGTRGINCGGPVSNCEVSLADASRVELFPQPAAGWEFVGFTGDCARVTAILMDQDRSCGATFRRVDEVRTTGGAGGTKPTTTPTTVTPTPGSTGASGGPPPARTVELKLDPPEHGSIVVDGKPCSREGGPCQVTRPIGSQVELGAVANPGFRFVRFTGDCATENEKPTVRLDAARSCGATFEAIPKPAPPANPKPRAEWTNATDGLAMIWIPPPPGERFTMGAHLNDRNRDESSESQSTHAISLPSGFWMNQTEVTRGAFARCVASKGCSAGRAALDGERLPVVTVTWSQAVAYCGWAGNRLPSEAEWEFAARGSTPFEMPYTWGENAALAAAFANAGPSVLDVGSKKPNSNGLFDMLGNVWEWTNSLYADYPWRPRNEDPAAPGPRVIRGGAYGEELKYLRIATRTSKAPGASTERIGFRCVRSPQ